MSLINRILKEARHTKKDVLHVYIVSQEIIHEAKIKADSFIWVQIRFANWELRQMLHRG